MLKPLKRATRPSTPNTKTAHVPQNVTISRPRLASEAEPNWATVNAMPPNAPSGAAHMMIRIIPKITRPAVSKPPTMRVRRSSARNEIDAAVTIASTRIFRISFSTNGPRKLSGSRWPVMKPTKPWSPPASPIDSLALARPSAVALPLKPEPGAITLPASRPSASATTVIVKK